MLIAGIVVFAFALAAQDSSVTSRTTVDMNGHRVMDGPEKSTAKSKDGSTTTETVHSINGRTVPIERVEERVLRDDANGRVVERLIHRFSPTGDPAPPVKETVEEQKRPDGSSTIQTTTYQGDINGSLQLQRKSTTELHKSGSTDTVETVVQQPTVNGSLEAVEKRSSVTVKDANGYREDTARYIRDGNGNFSLAVRQSTEHTQHGSDASDNTAEYEIGLDGRLQLHSQTAAKTVTRPDGSKAVELNVFGQSAAGTVSPDGSNKLKLQEQQLVERKPGPGGTMVETVSVRRPSLADPNTLGPAKQLSETVCRGKCDK